MKANVIQLRTVVRSCSLLPVLRGVASHLRASWENHKCPILFGVREVRLVLSGLGLKESLRSHWQNKRPYREEYLQK